MHQTRKTHNAHNETQRRLKKVFSNGSTCTYFRAPHYTYVEYRHGKLWLVHPDWVNIRFSINVVTSGPNNGGVLIHLKTLNLQRNINFLSKNPNLVEANLITNLLKEWFTNGGEKRDLEISLIHLKDHIVPGLKSIRNTEVSICSKEPLIKL